MSAIQMLITNLRSLNETDRAAVLESFKTTPAQQKPENLESEKKKGLPTVHGDFVKKICEEQKDAIAAFKAANPDQKGAHLVFVSTYKKEHAAEFEAFKSMWEAKKPLLEVEKPVAKEEPKPVIADDMSVLNGQQLRDIYHAFQGKPAGLKVSSPGAASTKELLIKAINEQRAGAWQGSTRAPMSDEQKAKMKAGREAAAMKKAESSPKEKDD
jgi:hypothetical protein